LAQFIAPFERQLEVHREGWGAVTDLAFKDTSYTVSSGAEKLLIAAILRVTQTPHFARPIVSKFPDSVKIPRRNQAFIGQKFHGCQVEG
jgi:hypothetical protein